MALVKIKVTYTDGRVAEVLATPRAQVATERQYSGLSEKVQVEGSYYLAWASLHYSGQEAAAFEAWLDTVADAEEVAAGEVRPTPPAPPAATSSD